MLISHLYGTPTCRKRILEHPANSRLLLPYQSISKNSRATNFNDPKSPPNLTLLFNPQKFARSTSKGKEPKKEILMGDNSPSGSLYETSKTPVLLRQRAGQSLRPSQDRPRGTYIDIFSRAIFTCARYTSRSKEMCLISSSDQVAEKDPLGELAHVWRSMR